METFSIGQLAKRVGISPITIRYYEKRKLLQSVRRSLSGYRQYTTDSIDQLNFIKTAKAVGFTLKEIGSLLILVNENSATNQTVKTWTLKKIHQMEEKMESLKKAKQELENWVKACEGKLPLEHCPILKNLRAK